MAASAQVRSASSSAAPPAPPLMADERAGAKRRRGHTAPSGQVPVHLGPSGWLACLPVRLGQPVCSKSWPTRGQASNQGRQQAFCHGYQFASPRRRRQGGTSGQVVEVGSRGVIRPKSKVGGGGGGCHPSYTKQWAAEKRQQSRSCFFFSSRARAGTQAGRLAGWQARLSWAGQNRLYFHGRAWDGCHTCVCSRVLVMMI